MWILYANLHGAFSRIKIFRGFRPAEEQVSIQWKNVFPEIPLPKFRRLMKCTFETASYIPFIRIFKINTKC
jgi:hypothetical protein